MSVTGCNYCGADEDLAIGISTMDSLSIVVGSQAIRLSTNSRVGQTEIDRATFLYLYDAIEDRKSPPARTLVLPLSGYVEPNRNELFVMGFALPEDLTRGDVYTVDGTFNVEAGLSTDPGLWMTRPLADANKAQVGFTRATYSFPPGMFTVTYRATSASGAVRVTQRGDAWAELDLDLRLSDAAGVASTIRGRLQVTTSRYTPPCT